MASNQHQRLWLLVALLLFAAALRIGHLVGFVEWMDEIWAVWHAQDSLADVLERTTTDWPPTFGILTWGWMQIAGQHLEVFRLVSVLYSLLGLAFTYRAALEFNRLSAPHTRSSRDFRAAFLAGTVFATMSFSIFSGVDARPYAPLLMLGPLAFWTTLRWLRQPDRRRALWAALSIAAMLYIGFTALIFIAYLTLFVLLFKPRLLPGWVGVGIAVLVMTLPLAAQFLANTGPRLDTMPQPPPPFVEAMERIYSEFGGSHWFLGLLAAAALLMTAFAVRFPAERRKILLLTLWVLVPAADYFGLANNEFLKPRYIWWVAIGLSLFIGYSVIRLPRAVQLGAIGLFILLPTIPVDFNMYRLAVTASPPYRSVFSWFTRHLRPGDVLVIDPNCECGKRPYGWDYFLRQYFPTGHLPIVEHPGSASRVWYLSTEGWQRDEELFADVTAGRRPSIFVGPWFFLLRLYEGPPSWQGAGFGGQVRLHGGEILDTGSIVADNESFQVKLWWSAEVPLDLDYSLSLAVLDSRGMLVAQDDEPPRAPDTPERTSLWQPGVYYEDYRTLQLHRGLKEGWYSLVATVYQWWDGVRLIPEDNPLWRRMGENGSYLNLQDIMILNID